MLGMQRAAAGIDIASVRRDVQKIGFDSALAEQLRGNRRGGAIRAIDQHAKAAQPGDIDVGGEPLDVAFAQTRDLGQRRLGGAAVESLP